MTSVVVGLPATATPPPTTTTATARPIAVRIRLLLMPTIGSPSSRAGDLPASASLGEPAGPHIGREGDLGPPGGGVAPERDRRHDDSPSRRDLKDTNRW